MMEKMNELVELAKECQKTSNPWPMVNACRAAILRKIEEAK